jgi:hypothetical protein
MSANFIMNKIVKRVPDVISYAGPFDQQQLRDIRLNIVKDMENKKFSHYTAEIKKITDEIQKTLESRTLDVLPDDYWHTTLPNIFPRGKTWWKDQSPELSYRKSQLSNKMPHTGISSILKHVVRTNWIDNLIGDANWMTAQQRILFKTVLSSYYKNNISIWPIMLNVDLVYENLINPDPADAEEKKENESVKPTAKIVAIEIVKSILAGSGTFVLKILQQIGNSSDNEIVGGVKFADLASAVFDQVPKMPPAEFEFVKDALDISPVYKTNMKKITLGSASIAEAHPTIDMFGAPVVVKFLKPIYAYYFMCECELLLTVVWPELRTASNGNNTMLRQSRQILMFLIREFADEFDYQGESENTIAGFEIYNQPAQYVRSAQFINVAIDPFPVIVQTNAPGITLKKALKEIMKKPRDVREKLFSQIQTGINSLYGIWFENLFWGTGFFHADAHVGNVLVPDMIMLESQMKRNEKTTIWLIDYGSAGQLSKKMQCQLIDTLITSGKFEQMYELVPPRHPMDTGDGERVPLTTHPLLIFFQSYNTLTPLQQHGLLQNILSNEAVILKQHRVNLKVSQAFIKHVWDVCEVWERSDLVSLSLILLNYSEKLDFGKLFLTIVKYGRDIGVCTFNETLMFGRGVAYLGTMNDQIWINCDNEEVCPDWILDEKIPGMLLKHPAQTLNFIRGRPVCS